MRYIFVTKITDIDIDQHWRLVVGKIEDSVRGSLLIGGFHTRMENFYTTNDSLTTIRILTELMIDHASLVTHANTSLEKVSQITQTLNDTCKTDAVQHQKKSNRNHKKKKPLRK